MLIFGCTEIMLRPWQFSQVMPGQRELSAGRSAIPGRRDCTAIGWRSTASTALTFRYQSDRNISKTPYAG